MARYRHCREVLVLTLTCAIFMCQARTQSRTQLGAIGGIVVSGEGLLVSNASVYAVPVNTAMAGRCRYFHTNEKGRFLIDQLAPGMYVVHAFKLDAGYPDAWFAFFRTDENYFPKVAVTAGRVSETTVNLGRKGALLSVRVFDDATGKLIESAGMQLTREDNPNNFLNTHSSHPDDPGMQRTWVPSLTAFAVRISADGYSDWSTEDATDIPCCRTLVLYPEEERTLVVRLKREGSQGEQ